MGNMKNEARAIAGRWLEGNSSSPQGQTEALTGPKQARENIYTVMGIVTGHNAHTVRLSIQLVPVKAHSTVKTAMMEGAVDWSKLVAPGDSLQSPLLKRFSP